MITLITVFELLSTLFFPLGQFARISFSNQQVNLYVYECFMGAAFLFLFIRYGFSPLRRAKISRFVMLFGAALLLSFAASLLSYDSYANSVGFLYFLRLIFYLIHFVYLDYHLHESKKSRRYAVFELYFIVAVLILTSWLQYIFYPNLRNLLYMGWDPHLYRVFGFFFEPYLAGAALGLSLLYVYFHGSFLRRFKYPVLVCLFVLIMLTFSRTVYAAVMATIFIIFIGKRKLWYFLGVLAFFIVLAFAIPKPEGAGVQLLRTFSINSRVENAKEGLVMWSRAPILGVGYNRIRYAKAKLGLTGEWDSSHAASSYHSSFITMLVAGGVTGLAAFILLLVKLGSVSPFSGYYLIFLSVLSLGDNALLHTFILFYLLKMLAVERFNRPSNTSP